MSLADEIFKLCGLHQESGLSPRMSCHQHMHATVVTINLLGKASHKHVARDTVSQLICLSLTFFPFLSSRSQPVEDVQPLAECLEAEGERSAMGGNISCPLKGV